MSTTNNTVNNKGTSKKEGSKTMSKSSSGNMQSAGSSHDNKSHVKAGSTQGAGGGKKQERNH
jgi:hypothetical protein